jgi:hypothetical protein
MNSGDLLSKAKTAYAATAQQVGRAVDRFGLLRDEPPPRRQRVRHWAYSLVKVHDSLAIAKLDVPWWSYRAIDVVDAWLAARQRPIRIFEFGSGASTIWLSRRAEKVHTVEHHKGFWEHIRPTFEARGNIDSSLVEPVPSEHPKVPSAKERHAGLDFADYVATIDDVGGSFDLIVIDGRAREACLAASLPHLAADGIIVFDNSRRRRYRRAISESGLSEDRYPGLTPTLPYPEQTSVLRSPGRR